MAGQTLAQMVRAKYPGAYDDLSDAQLEAAIDQKHPGAYADLPRSSAPAATEKPEQRLAGVGIQTVSDADWDKLTPLERMQGLLKAGGYGLTSMLGMGDAGHQAVDHPGATLASGAVPGVLSAAGKYGAPAIRAAAETTAKVLEHPAVGGTVGAVEGYRRGGLEGALFGSAAGMAGSSYTARYLRRMMPSAATAAAVDPASARMVEGMSASGRQAATPNTRGAVTPPPIPTPAAAPAAAAPAARSGVDALREQLMLRDPDWRTVDAVPIDAIKRDVVNGGSIIEAGESRVGLGDRLAKAVKDGDAAEIDRLAKAMRQRMHITAKSGR
jgi:hypothetical protein